MDPVLVGILGIIALVVLLAAGTPIAWSAAIVGAVGFVVLRGPDMGLGFLGLRGYGVTASYLLTVLPLFILMGYLATAGGIGKHAYRIAHAWVGHLPGGLAVATIGACAMFAAACGSSVATAAAVGRSAIDEMRRYGYQKGLAAGSVAAGGLLGILIPPSLIMVVYSVTTGESLGKLLIAGFIPGVLTAGMFSLMLITRAKLNPQLAPRVSGVKWKERVTLLKNAWSVGVLLVVVMGGIYSGILTPTEAAGAGAFFVLIVAVVQIKWAGTKPIKEAFLDSGQTIGMIFAIMIGISIFTFFLAVTGLPTQIAEFTVNLPLPPIVILIGILIIYIPLGMFLEVMSMIFLTLPIVYPIVVALGFDGIWFGILLVKMCEIAGITPPVGLNVYVIKSIAGEDVSLGDVFRGITWFFVAEIVTVAILVAFPQISLWLPSTMLSH